MSRKEKNRPEVQTMKKLRNNARGYILDMFAQHHMVKRTVLSFLSIVIMGFGTALFNVSGFGVDPFTSMNMSVAAVLGVSFGTYQLIIKYNKLSICCFRLRNVRKSCSFHSMKVSHNKERLSISTYISFMSCF